MTDATLGKLLIWLSRAGALFFSTALALWAIWGVVIFNPFIALLALNFTPFCFFMGRKILRRTDSAAQG